MTDEHEALLALLQALKDRGYGFVTVTPATHARVAGRSGRRLAHCLEDVLGWSLPFQTGLLDADVEALLHRADVLRQEGDLWLSLIRVSSLDGDLYLHSAFPTDQEAAVFFGPDSYRFANLIAAELPSRQLSAGHLIVDVGTGAGVGAIVAAKHCPEAAVMMTDVNPKALDYAVVNAAVAGVEAWPLLTDRLEGLDGTIDLATANPPFIIDHHKRLYRDGGGMLGGQIAHDMTALILPRLANAGKLILYTGSAIVDRKDGLGAALDMLAREHDCRLRYREIDPDVFGEELENPAYADVDRIALVTAIFERAG
jgi:methylase of polypeptide subunit release factors